MPLPVDAQAIVDLILPTPADKRGDLIALVAVKLLKTGTHRKMGARLMQAALDYGIHDT